MKSSFFLTYIFTAVAVASPVTLGEFLILLFHFTCFSLTMVISVERKEEDMPRAEALVANGRPEPDIFTW